MRRAPLFVLVLTACGLLAGCGGVKDRGKNQDFDRPKATVK